MADVILVLGDQLFYDLSPFPVQASIFMREDVGLATRVRHHQQKIVLIFSAMRHYRDYLISVGRSVDYTEYAGGRHEGFVQALLSACESLSARTVWTYEPHDPFFRDELRHGLGSAGIELRTVPSPMFLTTDDSWRRYTAGRKRRMMGDFYVHQRKEFGWLVDDAGQPVGGKWSFDEDNRQRIPKGLTPPPIRKPVPDDLTKEVIHMVKREFASHPGLAEAFRWPVTPSEATEWLDDFLEERLELFGAYEDALPKESGVLWHSALTPMLNIGLLTPNHVVEKLWETSRRREIPLNSLEGFLRQVVGWREFIKRMDSEYDGQGIVPKSLAKAPRALGQAWWEGTTGLPPIDHVIRNLHRTGWCHHIERLMVLGSTMLMADADCESAYQWFMEMFVDSADWVMRPNVIGMSQFADGGFFATKPYVSGSAYVLKMGDYPKGSWCDVWDGLYWRFIDQNREWVSRNQRMSMAVRSLDKLPSRRRDAIFGAAEGFIERVMQPIAVPRVS